MFKSRSTLEKMYGEILSDLSEVKAIERSHKLGNVAVLYSLIEWCDELDERGIESISINDIRKAFEEWLKYDSEISAMLDNLLDDKRAKERKYEKIMSRINNTEY